ncbi:hypothetical protein VTH82DRAFT_4671 [Thermothelomyces myriococcoides]
MAQPNGTPTLGRARSVRASANVGKPPQSAPRGNAPGAIPSASTSHPIALPTARSHVSLFLTNLRLLNLDQRPDWPDINAFTFSTKDLAQGQKKRIQSVEWVLYHLFRLWDPEETRNRLQPFFPPADQVQSLNLRAALLRGLEQAKKNGVLGRDAVIRKTMLDECKGERLEEVLAVFSSAVLKKVVAEQQLKEGGHPALAQTLALENRGSSGDRNQLVTLVIAHKASLRRMLDEKNADRTRFREFSDWLALKEKTIARKHEEVEAAKRSGREKVVTDEEKRRVRGMVRNNWAGNERWMEALFYGDSTSNKDGVLATPYDRVWRRVRAGRLAELEETSAGLLERLEHRVQGQQARLEKWQGFRQRMFGKSASETATKGQKQELKQKGIDLGFREHESLRLGRLSPRKQPRPSPGQLDSHYEALVEGLRSDLSKANSSAPAIPAFFRRPPPPDRPEPPADYDEQESEIISEINELEEAQATLRPSAAHREPIKVSKEPAFGPVLQKAKDFDDEHGLFEDEPLTPSHPEKPATVKPQLPAVRRRQSQNLRTKASRRQLNSTPKANRRPASPPSPAGSPPRDVTTPSPEPPLSPEQPVSPTQQHADQTLSSVSAASPSSIKKPRHRLSLAERTRLSLARRTSHANLQVPDTDEDEFDDEIEVDAAPEADSGNDDTLDRTPKPDASANAESSTAEHETRGYEDLATRTRRSLAGYEAARQKAQQERRKSLKKGGAPSTPAAAGRSSYSYAAREDEGNTTLQLAEELLNGGRENDYEAVFMSRPKLKTSPIGTPVRQFWDD